MPHPCSSNVRLEGCNFAHVDPRLIMEPISFHKIKDQG